MSILGMVMGKPSPGMVKLLLSELTEDEGALRMADLLLEGGFGEHKVRSGREGDREFVEVDFDKPNGSGTLLMTFKPKKNL